MSVRLILHERKENIKEAPESRGNPREQGKKSQLVKRAEDEQFVQDTV